MLDYASEEEPMTTQQQTDQPADLGERVATLEGGFRELSIRIDTLQRSVDNLRSETQTSDAALRAEIQAGDAALREEMQAGFVALAQRMEEGFAALREDINRFKNQVVFYILGAVLAVVVGVGGAIIAADRLS